MTLSKETIDDIIINICKKNSCSEQQFETISEEHTNNICKTISSEGIKHVEYKKCNDCTNCYQIAISNNIPIIPEYYPNKKQRKEWIKKNGKLNSQMYLALSKKVNWGFYYWSKYKHSLLFGEKISHTFTAPNKEWTNIIEILNKIMTENGISIIPSSLLFEKYNIPQDCNCKGTNKSFNLIDCLFTEELH